MSFFFSLSHFSFALREKHKQNFQWLMLVADYMEGEQCDGTRFFRLESLIY